MNNLEKKMVDTLIDLKENHHVVSVKAEFEAEGTRLEEAMRLKEIVTKAGLDLAIKIGGCEAIKDMYDARTIGVNTIVAPMIESSYAMKKYINAIDYVFPEEEINDIKFLLNIETITGFNNLENIVKSKEFDRIQGCVLGRVDMTGSLGMNRDYINSKEILDIAKQISLNMLEKNKEMIVGGGVSAQSLPFFKELPYISRFETRKIVFDAKKSLNDPNTDKGILKAVGFELMWIKNKRKFYEMIYNEDSNRINILEERYKKLIEQVGGFVEV